MALQTKEFTTTTGPTSWPTNYTLKLTITEQSVNNATNTSVVDWSLVLINTLGYTNFSQIGIGATIKINNVSIYSKAHAASPQFTTSRTKGSQITLASGTGVSVVHNSDGSLANVPVSAYMDIDGPTSTAIPAPATASGTMTFTSIPRASSVSASNANVGTASTITISKKSDSYSSTLYWSYAGHEGYINGSGSIVSSATKFTEKSVSFSIPAAWGTSSYSTTGGTCTLVLTTYNGNTQIGSSTSTTFTVSVAASSFSATNANVGANSTISVSRGSTAYSYRVWYSCGGLSGWVVDASYRTASTLAFPITTAFSQQATTSKTVSCSLTLYQYVGTTPVGSTKSTSFTITTTDAYAPTFTGSIVDSNATTKALTNNNTRIISGYSTASCTVTASPQLSATTSSIAIGGTTASLSGNTGTRSITKATASSYAVRVTDSRGYTRDGTISAAGGLINYVTVSCNPVVTRTTPTGSTISVTLSGNYFNSSFGSGGVANTLTVTGKYKPSSSSTYTNITLTPIKSGNTYSCSATVTGVSYTQSCEFVFNASDKLTSVEKRYTTPVGTPVFDWDSDDMSINVPLYMKCWAGTAIPNGSNLNNYTSAGRYFSASSSNTFTNAPVNGAFDLFVLPERSNETEFSGYTWAYGCQFFKSLQSNIIYYRYIHSGSSTAPSFSAWSRIGAGEATHAVSADTATYATSAGSATSATNATNATNATSAKYASYLWGFSGNETAIASNAKTATGLWINYRPAEGGSVSDSSYAQVTSYSFGNRKGSTNGVTVYAGAFSGSVATSNLSGAVAIANGGTGATTAAGANENLSSGKCTALVYPNLSGANTSAQWTTTQLYSAYLVAAKVGSNTCHNLVYVSHNWADGSEICINDELNYVIFKVNASTKTITKVRGSGTIYAVYGITPRGG